MKYVPVETLEKYMAEVHLDRTYPSTGIQLRQLLASEALDAVPVEELEKLANRLEVAAVLAEGNTEWDTGLGLRKAAAELRRFTDPPPATLRSGEDPSV